MWIITIAAFVTAYYFVNVVMPPIKKALKILPGQRIKPFDCVVCLSVWTAVVLWFLPVSVSLFLAVVFGAGVLSIKIQ